MRLMRRLRDGKLAVYDQGCVESGRWEEVVEKPPAPPPPPEPQKPPRPPRPPKQLVRRTDVQQVTALFAPPVELQTETKMALTQRCDQVKSECEGLTHG